MRTQIFLFLVYISAGLISCKAKVDPSLLIARQGNMDLSSWDIKKKGKLSLDGEWEFYYNQLLSPADFKNDSARHPDGFAVVPGDWNDINAGTKKNNGQGYATYRLLLTHTHFDSLMALRIWQINTAYRLWVNDELVAGNGKVSPTPDSATAQLVPVVKVFDPPAGDTLQIIIQVVNFLHAKGGIRSSIDLGYADTVMTERDNARVAELWLAG